MHPLAPSPPAVDDPAGPRLVLRDGTVATVRRSTSADRATMRRFFHDLSPESRRWRFFTAAEPTDALVDRLCDSDDETRSLTLVAVRQHGSDAQFIAVASYLTIGPAVAEAAFAVNDRFQGKGLTTELLERLAAIAASHGFRRFDATTLADNRAMLEVFHDSGFEVRSKSDLGVVEITLNLTPSAAGVVSAETRRRHATAASLRPMLEPGAVAVVGASRDPGSIGRRILDALVAARFPGPLYPINPATKEIAGLRSYAAMREVPVGVDLAVIAVPGDRVLTVVDDCAAAGVKSVVVITAGYAEAGDVGRARQQELVDRVRGYGMRMVGPNCMGVINANPARRLNASFSPLFPKPGHLGLSSQSGALGLAILALAAERGLGLSTFVSVGNKADVSSNDLLEYWEEDDTTHVMLLYLESFGNPRRFARLAKRIGRTKPIVAVKAGRTRAGSRAAGSHTAALAANDTAVEALFHQSGVIRADTIDDMFDVAACLDSQPLPAGRRVAVVTNAGGPGILAVDACENCGLTVPAFSPATRARLATFLPAAASTGNPVDMVASAGPEEYRQAIEVALADAETDALLVIFAPVDVRQSEATLAAIRQGIANARRSAAKPKPILACVMAEAGRPQPLEVGDERVPAYAFPENAVRALAKVAAYAEWRTQPPGLLWGFDDVYPEDARHICRGAAEARGEDWLTDEEMRRVLNAFRLPVVASAVAYTAEEAAASAAMLGFPVVAKIRSHAVQHKTEIGGVLVNLQTADAVKQAFDSIMTRAKTAGVAGNVDGVLIQPMLTSGVETMMGIAADGLFGPLIGFGLGGIFVELMGDLRFRIAPLTDRDADELLHEIRGFPMLKGYRGRPPADLDALRDVLLRVSRLADEVPEIIELDLNPIIALPEGHGCRIVDARIKVRAAVKQ
ncbi:MAG: GNAT family N-acetyltransferase [Vicinamibacterales bacterium]